MERSKGQDLALRHSHVQSSRRRREETVKESGGGTGREEQN